MARKCQVSERTIYRDVISISEANIPIYFDGGYRLLHNGFLPPTNLSATEVDFLKALLKSPLFGKGKPFREAAERIADKIDSSENPKSVDSIIHIGAITTDKPGNSKIFSVIENSVRDGHTITMKYLSLKNETTERKIAPYAIVFRGHSWYLIGFCYLKNEIRTFRLGRIISLTIQKEKFKKPPDFSLERYFSSSWEVFGGKLVKFKVHFNNEAAVVVKSSFHHQGEIINEQDDGSVIYEVIVAGIQEFLRWVMQFGSNAEILEPVFARKEIRTILHETLKKYN